MSKYQNNEHRLFDYTCGLMQMSLDHACLVKKRGRVIQVVGSIVRASITGVKIGEICLLVNNDKGYSVSAEVVGFVEGTSLMTPLGDLKGISANTEVIATNHPHTVGVSPALVGNVLDGMGNLINNVDDKQLICTEYYPLHSDPPDVLLRNAITTPLQLGVKAIDGFMTCAEGQRLGIFAAAGVGKSTLLAMLARNADVDITVLVLIGERGREVKEFIQTQLGEDGMARAVLVVATADKPAMMRVRAAFVGTAIAEYYRDQGKRVLLLMDSVTRFARALREIGLAAGEIPTRRGYPASVFSSLPVLFERAGQSDRGSITALYTVLVEGDDMNEPVSDESRSLLDGHIVLSRDLAQASHFPAIDVAKSLSRIMHHVVPKEHLAVAARIRRLIAKYRDIEFLVRMGEYQSGSDKLADEALKKWDKINELLRQDTDEVVPMEDTVKRLKAIVS